MVYYLKYRPQTIEELDSTSVREKLSAVLSNPQNIPHAFLFTGPKGLGKTSTARIIAKVVNCLSGKTKRGKSGIEPCNICESCLSITAGTNMDVLEVDAASNRGIDEIRELKETIKLTPLSSKKKVYIIDEVHMLTTEAFNALLKTLEEPPSHAMFLLCTTEPQKIPPTILSRTFHIAFLKATNLELVRSLNRIVEAEKLKIAPDGLERIAELADGGFRDGTKMLEEVVSLAGGEKITAALIEKKYHISGITQRTDKIISHLVQRKVKELLTIIAAMDAEGSDVRYTLEQVIKALHTELLRRSGVTITSDMQPVGKQGAELQSSELKDLLLLLTAALSEMKYSVLPQLPFELAVIEWGEREGAERSRHTEQNLSAELGNVGSGEIEETLVDATISVTSLRKHAGNMQKIKALYGESKEEVKKTPPGPPANVSVLNFSAKGEITPEWLSEFWTCIIRDIKQHNHTLAGVLRGCMIKSFDRKALVIETAYAFHREKLDNGKTKAVIEEICRNLTGNPVSVTVELKS